MNKINVLFLNAANYISQTLLHHIANAQRTLEPEWVFENHIAPYPDCITEKIKILRHRVTCLRVHGTAKPVSAFQYSLLLFP